MTHWRTWLALLLTLAFSCGEQELTQLMVVVDTDFDLPEELDELTITVTAPEDFSNNTATAIPREEDLPMRLAVVHRSGPLGPIQVKVDGFLGGLPQIQRRAEVFFVEGEVRVLRMDLLRSCQGVSCSGEEACGAPTCTCGAEGCRPRRVTEDELPVWEGPTRLDFGMPDMGPVDMNEECVPVEEVCNGEDDDCDESVDETFDLMNDMRNCGSCGNLCDPSPTRGSSMCASGECTLVCDSGFRDCDDDASTGCEASLSSAATCGSCEQTCSGTTPFCDIDTCVAECPVGSTLCTDSCADLDSAVRNCGTCGNECNDAPNASPLCTEGSCGLRCDTGFFNCDMASATGCESNLREQSNCGACGVSCEADFAMTSCATGTCELVGCSPGYEDCDGDLMNGCESNLDGDPTTCGTCDTVCPVDPANATSVCDTGSCALNCDAGYRDCNSDPSDGCETFLGDVESCNGCGILCDGTTPVCSGSVATGFACSADCAAGEVDCGDSCVDTSTDVRNCGACDNVCPDPMRASPTCAGGSCGFTCDMGFEDCDGDAANGCEADFSSTSDCGSCGNVCDPVPNGTVACNGTCEIATCSGTNRDCDGTYDNGCETDITSDTANCGGCGVTCMVGNRVGAVSCVDGSCVIDDCDAGFADCDGDFATGCEQRLGTRDHCSECFDSCGGGATGRCCDGSCSC